VNTLDDRYIKPKELLESYIDLARFGEDTGVLKAHEVDRLYEQSYVHPERAQEVVLWARELREAIHEVFRAIMDKQPAPPVALARLNAYVQAAAEHMRLVAVKRGFEWTFDEVIDFDSVLWPIARSAADLLASDQLHYVRRCSSKTCEWFFLDTSKNHHRRWCDMTRCGNRAKVRRFYNRRKKSS
jgi:predicted RNA-binding Zn ribbon-like protein